MREENSSCKFTWTGDLRKMTAKKSADSCQVTYQTVKDRERTRCIDNIVSLSHFHPRSAVLMFPNPIESSIARTLEFSIERIERVGRTQKATLCANAFTCVELRKYRRHRRRRRRHHARFLLMRFTHGDGNAIFFFFFFF